MKSRNFFFLTEVLNRTELSLLLVLVGLMFFSVLGFAYSAAKTYGIVEPAYGGTLTEGIIGKPRFINPLLAQTDADRDLASLIYAGLLKYDGSGNLVPRLAESYDISEDGLLYTVTLKEDLYWSDGERLTTDDVIFTIQLAKNPLVQSPRRANWEGVEAEKIDERSVKFHLQRVYVPFLDNLTLGIMPKHVWDGIPPSQFALVEINTNPIGAGPYKIDSVRRDSVGSISEIYLKANKYYALGKPFITNLNLRFFNEESEAIDALKKKLITSLGSVSPKYTGELKEKGRILYSINLQRVIAVFFNKDAKRTLGEQSIREALNISVDKHKLIEDVLYGYGLPIEGPIPNMGFGNEEERANFDPELAKDLILKSEIENIQLTLTTANNEELVLIAEFLKKSWENIGLAVDIKTFELEDLEQLVIGPRRYDAFVYGEEVIGKNPDLFPFWHSSQRSHPGYNIALYANSKTDRLLESVRTEQNSDKRAEIYANIQNEIKSDIPAVFLFSPHYIYAAPDNLGGLNIEKVSTASERFSTVNEWYINKKYIWKIFSE